MSDTYRREKWFRGIRRLFQVDPAAMDLLKREIEIVKRSKSYEGELLQNLKKKKSNRILCYRKRHSIETK